MESVAFGKLFLRKFRLLTRKGCSVLAPTTESRSKRGGVEVPGICNATHHLENLTPPEMKASMKLVAVFEGEGDEVLCKGDHQDIPPPFPSP